jgi:hypothetical protein
MGNTQTPPDNATAKFYLRKWGYINQIECRVCQGDFDKLENPTTRLIVRLLITAKYDNFCNEGFHCDDPEHVRIFHELEDRKHNCCEKPDIVVTKLLDDLHKL